MGSALLDTTIEGTPGPGARPTSSEPLRQQVAERLAAHRSRRAAAESHPAPRTAQPARPNDSRSARIAATVAERYAHSQSYRAFLAAEAERSVQQARAAADVAALNAQAVAAAQERLLRTFDEEAEKQAALESDARLENGNRAQAESHARAVFREEPAQELNFWPEPVAEHVAEPAKPRRAIHKAAPALPQAAVAPIAADGKLTVRFYEDASATHVGLGAAAARSAVPATRRVERNDAEAQALDEEIAFRQAPVFEEPAGPPMPLPANLIEFPRQLVASRKARPRLAEGPLRDEAGDAPADGQLRIFEVDPAQISTAPVAAETPAAQWTSIWLETQQAAGDEALGDAESFAGVHDEAAPLPQVATIGRRVLASAINAGVISVGMVAFAAVFVLTTNHGIDLRSGASVEAALRGMAGQIAGEGPRLFLTAAAAAAAFLYLLYQALFFSLSQATPGMRCARIALCTFDDENPTRRARRRRMLAVLLSACPLGMGFVWAALDERRLTWHDRVSGIYLRSY